MEKKVVSKELHDCLDYLIKLGGKEWLIKKHAIKKYSKKTVWDAERYKPLNDLSLDYLADLLYNGYRLEETKEEKLIRYYNNKASVTLGFTTIEEVMYKRGIVDCYEILEGKKFSLK